MLHKAHCLLYTTGLVSTNGGGSVCVPAAQSDHTGAGQVAGGQAIGCLREVQGAEQFRQGIIQGQEGVDHDCRHTCQVLIPFPGTDPTSEAC